MYRKNIPQARNLRRNQTDTERKLWSILRNSQLDGIKFKRQFPVENFILDFYSPEHKLAVEADGGQHYNEIGQREDEIRTAALANLGIKVLRFSNIDILTNIEGVCEVILLAVEEKKKKDPSP